MQLAQLQNGEADIEGFVDHLVYFQQLNSNHVFPKVTDIEAVRLACQLPCFLSIRKKTNVGSLGVVLTCLPIHCIIHKFEEVFLQVILGCGTEMLILLDVGGQPRGLLEANDIVDLVQLESVLNVELEIEVMDTVVFL